MTQLQQVVFFGNIPGSIFDPSRHAHTHTHKQKVDHGSVAIRVSMGFSVKRFRVGIPAIFPRKLPKKILEHLIAGSSEQDKTHKAVLGKTMKANPKPEPGNNEYLTTCPRSQVHHSIPLRVREDGGRWKICRRGGLLSRNPSGTGVTTTV